MSTRTNVDVAVMEISPGHRRPEFEQAAMVATVSADHRMLVEPTNMSPATMLQGGARDVAAEEVRPPASLAFIPGFLNCFLRRSCNTLFGESELDLIIGPLSVINLIPQTPSHTANPQPAAHSEVRSCAVVSPPSQQFLLAACWILHGILLGLEWEPQSPGALPR